MRLEGFEPPTFGSVDRRSNPLSYKRVAWVAGLEPASSVLETDMLAAANTPIWLE